jgi:hypothetical protein
MASPDLAFLHESAEVFSLIDTDGDGSISRDEIKRVFNLVGVTPTEDAISNLFATADANSDGLISLPEFREALSRRVRPRDLAPLLAKGADASAHGLRTALAFLARSAGVSDAQMPAEELHNILLAHGPAVEARRAAAAAASRRGGGAMRAAGVRATRGTALGAAAAAAAAAHTPRARPSEATVAAARAAAAAAEQRAWVTLQTHSIRQHALVDTQTLIRLLLREDA